MNDITILKKQLSSRGGLENQTLHIAKAFQKKGKQVTLLTTGEIDPHFKDPSLEFHSFELKSSMNFRQVYEFDRLCQNYLKQHPSKIIFGMERNRNQTHLRLGNGIHKAFLHHLAQFEGPLKQFSHFFNPAHHTFLRFEKSYLEDPKIQLLIANSAMVKNEILHFYKTDPAKIEVIHNGVDWVGMEKAFEEQEENRLSLLDRFQLDPHRFHFLFVGHHYLRKGLQFLFRGLSQLKTRDFHLSIVGHERKPSSYQHLAKELHIEKNVTFFGHQADVRPFYQLSDCLVIPSIYDPFSNTTLEALSMGLFVVSSKTNGGHEVLQNESGVVIEDLLSIEAITHALESALNHKKTKTSSQRIRATVKHLDLSLQLDRLTSLCLGEK